MNVSYLDKEGGERGEKWREGRVLSPRQASLILPYAQYNTISSQFSWSLAASAEVDGGDEEEVTSTSTCDDIEFFTLINARQIKHEQEVSRAVAWLS